MENELWDYTAWELFKAFIRAFLWQVWQFLKPHHIYRKLRPVSEIEILELRQKVTEDIKAKAAEKLGGNPEDYIVRPIEPENGLGMKKQ